MAILYGYLSPSVLVALAKIAIEQSDHAQSQAYLAESLSYWQEIGDRANIARLLESFANLNQAQGKGERATRLWGAGDRLREEIGCPLSPNEREEYGHTVAAVRATLGEESLRIAWKEGQAMTMEQAVAYALEEEIV